MLQKILGHYIKGLISLLILFQPIIAKANTQILDEFNDYTYAIIQIEINNIILDDYINSYDTIYNHYYSLSGLTNSLGFDITYDLFAPLANGWIYDKDNLFIFNGETSKLQIGKQEFNFNDDEVVYFQNEIYITVEAFARVMDMKYIYKANELVLELISTQITPAEQKALLQRKYQNLKQKSSNQSELIQLPADITKEYELISMPIIEFNAKFSYEDGLSDYNGSDSNDKFGNSLTGDVALYARNHLLYMDSNLYLNYDVEDNIDAKLINFSKLSNNNNLLGKLKASRIEFGDVNSYAGEGIGIIATNSGYNNSYNFDDTIITGQSFEDWRVELFVNEKFIDSQIIGTDGRYTFENVQLNRKNNLVEIIKYGPYGQIEREVKNYNLTTDILKDSKLFYDLQFIKSNDYLLGEQTQIISNNDGDDYFVKFGKKINSNNSIYLQQLKQEEADELTLTIVNQHNAFINYYSIANDAYDDEKYISINSYYNDESKDFDANMQYQLSESDGDLINTISGKFSKDYERFSYNNSLSISDLFGSFNPDINIRSSYNYKNCLRTYHNFSYDDDDSSAEIAFRCIMTKQWFGSSVTTDLKPDINIDKIDFQYHLNINKKTTYDFDLTYNRDSSNEGYEINNELLYKIYQSMRIGFYFDHYQENAESVIGATVNFNGITTFVYNPYSKIRYSFIGSADSERGILGIRSYIDENYNDVFDQGDQILKNIQYTGLGNLAKENAAGGVTFYKSLTNYSIYPVMVNYKYLDNVDITPKQETIRVSIVTSKVNYIDYKFVYYGLIDGNLLLKDKSINGAKLELYNSSGEQIADYITESDGYFYFQDVPIGEYVIKMTDTSLSRFEMTDDIDFAVTITKDNLYVEYLEINILGLTSQAVEDLILGKNKPIEPEVEIESEVIITEEKPLVIEKPVNVAIFKINPLARPIESEIMFNPTKELKDKAVIFHPYANLNTDAKKIDPSLTKSIKAVSLPDSVLVYGSNNDNLGKYEVEIAESQRKGDIVSFMIDFNRTYPQIFTVLDMKVRMQDKSRKFIYKLKTDFDSDASEAIEYCDKLSLKKLKCQIEKETKIVGNFATKEDAYNYKTKMALEGVLEGKEANIRKVNEQTEVEIRDINQKSLNKDQLIQEYIAYLGGVSYELVISSGNMFDKSVENFCSKYSDVLQCKTTYITNHGASEYKMDLRRAGLTKKTTIDIYDIEIEDNIWYFLTAGEFKDIDESVNFCNSIGIEDNKCLIYQR